MKAFLLFLFLIILIIAVLKILNRKFIQKNKYSMTGRKQGIHSNTVTPDEREADFNKWYVNTIKKQLSK